MNLADASASKDLDWFLQFDEDTGFYRRVSFQHALAERCSQVTTGQTLLVLTVSFTGIRAAVNLFGAEVRQSILATLASQWRALESHGWLIGRYAQDIFVMASPIGLEAQSLPEKILKVIGMQSVPSGVLDLPLTPVVGAANFPEHADTAAFLIENARLTMDHAMVQIARGKRSAEPIAVFTAEIGQSAQRESTILMDISRNLDSHPWQVGYRAAFDLQNNTLDSIGLVPVLQHPNLGDVGVIELYRLARKGNLSAAVGEKVLEACFQGLAEVCGRAKKGIKFTIPLPYEFIFHTKLQQRLKTLADRYQIKPAQVVFSVPEKHLGDYQGDMLQGMQALQATGFGLALTDFGQGKTNFHALTRLPIDRLYLRGDLLQSAKQRFDDFSLLSGLLSMAAAIKTDVVIDGMDTPPLVALAKRAGACLGTGRQFGATLSTHGLLALLEQQSVVGVKSPAADANKPQLLIVDDEENLLNALRRLLHKDGYQIHTARSASDAFDILAEHRIDVVLSDQRMPNMNGTDMLMQVKEMYPNTVRLVLSGYTELGSVTDAINKGAIYKYLTKPWDDDQLRANIKEAFQRHRIQQQNQHLQAQVEAANGELINLNHVLERRVAEKLEQIERHASYREVMQEVMDNLPVGVLGMGSEADIVLVNRQASVLLGVDAGEMLGQVHGILPASLIEKVFSLLEHQDTESPLHEVFEQGGKTLWASITRMGLQSDSAGCMICVQEVNT